MIKYFAYYSFGGYKDMYLGCSDSAQPATYYLPFVENGTDTDPAKAALPKIELITPAVDHGLTADINRLESNGGYSVFYSPDFHGQSLLVVRDIMGTQRDSNGRDIPFVMIFLGELADAALLGRAAAYLIGNFGVANSVLGPLFEYDARANGLRFELGQLNQWLKQAAAFSPLVNTADLGEVDLVMTAPLSVLVSAVNGNDGALLNRLGLPPSAVKVLHQEWVLPANNSALALERRNQWLQVRQHAQKQDLKKYAIYAAIAVIAAIILYNIF